MARAAWRAAPASWLLHVSFAHAAGNAAAALALGLPLEASFGAPRVAAAWLLSCAAGAALSSALDDRCAAVVGASGGVFGLLGFGAGALAVGLAGAPPARRARRPVLRAAGLAAAAVALAGAAAAAPRGVSHASHVGGVVAGLAAAPPLLLLPEAAGRLCRRRRRRGGGDGGESERRRAARAAAAVVAGLFLLVVVVVAPAAAATRRGPVRCSL